MTLKLNGTNSEAAPAYAGDDADTGLQCGTDELKLVTGGTARATVDSSGRLLVGTSSTSATCTSVFAGRSDGATDPVLRLEVNSTSPANGTALGGLNFASSGLSAFQAGARIAAVRDGGTWTNGSSHPTYLEFATTADGASSPTERMRILSSGGITFNGDTAAANALDDYEEGDWTPSLEFGGASSGLTYNRQHGTYTKIGNIVYLKGHIGMTNKGTSTGHARLRGFPYTPHGSSANGAPNSFTPIADRGTLNLGSGFVGAAVYLQSSIANGAFLYKYKFDGSGNSSLQSGSFANSTEIDLNFVYRIA